MKITKLVSNPSGFDRSLDSRGRRLGAFINLNEEVVEIQNDSWLLPKNISGWMDWEWYSKDWKGFAKEEKISQKIEYKIWFKAIRDEKKPAFEDNYELEVTVKVSEERREALKEYNKQLGVFYTQTALAGVLAIVAAGLGILVAPAAIVAAAAAVVAAGLATRAKGKADEQFKIMDDR